MSTSPTVNPLGYQGVRSPNPPAIWFRPRDPDLVKFKDFRNYEIGDLWQNTVSKQFFILSSVATAQGMWDNITGPSTGGIAELSDDLGNLATPALGIVQIAGGTNIKTTAAGSAVTIDIDGLISVANGGTGVGTLTGVVTGNGIAAFTASPVTQYNVLVGAASNAIASIAPSATSGVPLISQGVAANPVFGTAVVAGGGTGIATTTAYAPICGGTTATGAFQAAATGLATAGWVLTSNGNAALPEWKAPALSGLIQDVYSTTSAYITCTTVIPSDDTIPQNTEGDEVLTVTITPKSAASTLEIEYSMFSYCANDTLHSVALFVDASPNAIAAVYTNNLSKSACSGVLRFKVASGSTTARTYKIRVGPSTAQTIEINGAGGARYYGGVASTVFTVKEIL